MGREAGFGVNRLSTKRVHHTAKNARFHGYRPIKAGAAAAGVAGAAKVTFETRSYVLWGGTRSHPFPPVPTRSHDSGNG